MTVLHNIQYKNLVKNSLFPTLIKKYVLKARQVKNKNTYKQWINSHDQEPIVDIQEDRTHGLKYRPLISIIAPTYNTPEIFFHEMIISVLEQAYDNWELILVDDASQDTRVRELIKQYARKDKRIKYKFLDKNKHISGTTNEGIGLASGEFVSLLDHDDILYPNTLLEVVKVLNQGQYDFIYTDEDKITEDKTNRHEPFLKPSWNQDFLYSVNYITHFTTIRKNILDRYGYENSRYNGAQDWELFLRITRNTPKDKIYHIPKVLYGWRVHSKSTAKDFQTKPYVVQAQKSAIESQMKAIRYKNFNLIQDVDYPGQWKLSFSPTSNPKVSIITNSRYIKNIEKELNNRAGYKNYEIISVQENENYKQIREKIKGKYIIFIDKKINTRSLYWIEEMIGDAGRSDTGFVLSRLGSRKDLSKNIYDLLGESRASLILKMGWRGVSGHLYRTTRYNIKTVYTGVAMVELKKLDSVARGEQELIDIPEWSNRLRHKNYSNLYNPYVRVVK